MIGSSVHNYKSQEEIQLGKTTPVNDMDGWYDHRSLIPKVKEKSSLASRHKLMTRMDDTIIDPHFQKSRRFPPWASHHKSLTWLDDRINDPPYLSSEGEIALGEFPQVKWIGRMIGLFIHNFKIVKRKSFEASHNKSMTWMDDRINDPHLQKSSGFRLWRIATSQWLGEIAGSTIHHF